MERETKTITTPKGKTLVLKTYVNARERNALRSVMIDSMKIDLQNLEGANELSGSILEKSEAKLIETVVVSYDGSVENILNRLLDESPEEYDFVVEESGKINKGFTPAK